MTQQKNRAHPHSIKIEPAGRPVEVSLDGVTVARSGNALILREGPLPPVYYLPREDVNMSLLVPTDHSTHCPFKGDASYWSIRTEGEGEAAENAVWSYETPIDDVKAIAGHMAFYPDKVTLRDT